MGAALVLTLADYCCALQASQQPLHRRAAAKAARRAKSCTSPSFRSLLVGRRPAAGRTMIWKTATVRSLNALHCGFATACPPSAVGLTLFLCSGWARTAAHCAWRGSFLLRCRPVPILGALPPAAVPPALQGLHQQHTIPGRCRGNCRHFLPRAAGAGERLVTVSACWQNVLWCATARLCCRCSIAMCCAIMTPATQRAALWSLRRLRIWRSRCTRTARCAGDSLRRLAHICSTGVRASLLCTQKSKPHY